MAAPTYVVVLRGASGARLREGESIAIPSDTPNGQVTLTIRTRHADERFRSTVPRGLWIEVVGATEHSLNSAMNAYWTVATKFLPLLAIATNAPVDDLDVHLAFDTTEGENEHEFYQHLIPDETSLPTTGRRVPVDQLQELLAALVASTDAARIHRGCAFYREALRYLKPGQEVLSVAFLWMAVEALTKVALRKACAANGCDEDQLVILWGLAKSQDDSEGFKQGKRKLDGEARRRFIFHDDAACQEAALDASDRLEHAYADFDEVRKFAVSAKELGAAQHIRRAIFGLLGMKPETVTFLTTGRYENPRASWPMTKIVRGTFIGPIDKLAAASQQYPMLLWKGGIQEIVLRPDGAYDITPQDTVTILCGEGVQYRQQSFEIWGPENDPIEPVATPAEALTGEAPTVEPELDEP
jgi:hypothetical protein